MPALIFDCDGVLADTERDGHRPAFNATFAEVGLPVEWSEAEYGVKLEIGGGKERMASLLTDEFVRANGLPTDADGQKALLADWHKRKTARYKEMVLAGQLPARPGIARIVDDAIAAGWTLAVASTSAEESVRAVLEHAVGADNAARFAVFAGDIVPAKKPDPAIYTLALERLAALARRSDRDRGLAQRAAGGRRRGAALRGHGLGLHGGRGHERGGARGHEPGRSRRARHGAGKSWSRGGRRDGDARQSRRVPESTPTRQGDCMSENALPRAEMVVRVIAQTAVDNETYFCELDAVVGDGDFGYSLARGFEVVLGDWDAMEYSDVGGLLKKTAIVLSKRIGGTSGPIWGTAFLRAGGALNDVPEPSGEQVIAAMRAAIEGIKQRGNTDLGDKTLIDALVPAVDELEAALPDGAGAAIARAAATAREKAEATKGMVAMRGRASYTGERSRDSVDAGAIGIAVMFEAVSKAWQEAELELA